MSYGRSGRVVPSSVRVLPNRSASVFLLEDLLVYFSAQDGADVGVADVLVVESRPTNQMQFHS